MTGKVSRRKYDAAFKEEVLQMVFNGHPVSEVAVPLVLGRTSFTAIKAATRPKKTKGKSKPCLHRITRHFTGASGSWRRSGILKKNLGHFQSPDLKQV